MLEAFMPSLVILTLLAVLGYMLWHGPRRDP